MNQKFIKFPTVSWIISLSREIRCRCWLSGDSLTIVKRLRHQVPQRGLVDQLLFKSTVFYQNKNCTAVWNNEHIISNHSPRELCKGYKLDSRDDLEPKCSISCPRARSARGHKYCTRAINHAESQDDISLIDVPNRATFRLHIDYVHVSFLEST